ncbi:MAG: fibronectin type III domain-containing protein, partial [Bacteroidota bacterium]
MKRNSFLPLYILAFLCTSLSYTFAFHNTDPEKPVSKSSHIHEPEEIKEAIQNLTASNITPYAVDLTWDAIDGAAEYFIWLNNQRLSNVTTNQLHLTTLTPGNRYSFRVLARYVGGGYSDSSPTIKFDALEEVNFNPPIVCNTTTNLSEGKLAIQSTTKSGGDAAFAVDGSLSESNLQHTLKSDNPWWQVDLGDVYHIKDLFVYNRTSCCGDRIKNFHVFISPYPFSSFATVTSLQDDPNVYALQASNTNEALYTFELSETVVGRYVRIQLPGKQTLHMKEVVVMGCTGAEEPLGVPQNLQATTVTANSITLSWDPVNEAEKYIIYQDGTAVKEVTSSTAVMTGLSPETWYGYTVAAVRGTEVSSKSGSIRVQTLKEEPDPLGVPQNLQASNITFTSVNLNWEGVGGAEKYNVYQDGVKVKEVTTTNTQITGLSQDTEYSFHVAAVRGSETSPKSNTETIRTLKEEEPVPPGSCSSPVNLALNKSATQSSVYNDGNAAYAVNGVTTYNASQLQQTKSDTEAWWQVDLEDVYHLRQVKIFNRTNCCGGRIKNFMVFISPYPISNTATVAQLKNDDNVTAINGPNTDNPTYELNVADGVIGRYVRVQLQDKDHLHMHEVEVYGCSGIDPLGTPQNLQASNITFTSVNLNWEGVGGAEKYNVYQDGVKVKEVTNTSTQITGLSQDTEYSFRVAAVRGNETSPKSNTATIRTLKEEEPVLPGSCSSPVNLALNKPATSSSIRNGGQASYAVNGNTVYNASQLQHTQ